MIPRLYPGKTTQFTGLGYGGMADGLDCQVTRQVNGPYELTMRYPVMGRRFAELDFNQIITATVGPDEPVQPFRIHRITPPLQGECTIYARHAAYDLMGHTCDPFYADSLAAAVEQLNSGAVVQPHGFDITAGFTSEAAINSPTPRSVWSLLGGQKGSLLDVYGGEWLFNGFRLELQKRLGAARGLVVRYGKNLKTLEQDKNITNTWTAVHPFWLSADGTVCVTLPEKTVSTGVFDYVRVMTLDLSAEFDVQPTEEQLRQRTLRYISFNSVGIPDVALTVDFVPLEQTEEYKNRGFLTSVHLGDTVAVEFPTSYHPTTGEPRAFVTASSRVVETVWLPMEDRYKSVRLGKKRANFVSTMAQVQKEVAWLMTRR